MGRGNNEFIGTLIIAVLVLGCSFRQEHKSMEQASLRTGTVEGTIRIGPLCPGPERVDQPCVPPPDLYTSHKVIVLRQPEGKKVREVSIDSSGVFRSELEAGRYLLDVVPHDIGMEPFQPREVFVQPGAVVQVHIDIDTGMLMS